MVTFQDMTMKSKLIMPSSKDLKNILKLMFQESPEKNIKEAERA